jgi:hypothetical protein
VLPLALLLCTASAGVEVIEEDAGDRSVLVLEIEHEEENAREAALLNTVIADELEDQRGLEVITTADIQKALELEGERQALGCDKEQESCLSEIADAMGAQYVVFGELGRLGQSFVVTLSVYDSVKARSAGREVIQSPTLDVLPARIAEVIDELFPRASVGEGKAEPTGSVAGAVTAATGGVLALAGGVGAVWADQEIKSPDGTNKDVVQIGGFVGVAAVAVGVGLVGLGAWQLWGPE